MVSENFSSSSSLGVELDSFEIWGKDEQFVVVMSPPKGKKGKKKSTPWVAFKLMAMVYKEKEGMYTGECPALGVASQGDDEQEARTNIQEAVTLFLEDCAEVGTLERILLKRRFKETHKQRKKEKSTATRPYTISSLGRMVFQKKNDKTHDYSETESVHGMVCGMVSPFAHHAS